MEVERGTQGSEEKWVKVLVGGNLRKQATCVSETTINVNITEIQWAGLDWINWDQDRGRCRALVTCS